MATVKTFIGNIRGPQGPQGEQGPAGGVEKPVSLSLNLDYSDTTALVNSTTSGLLSNERFPKYNKLLGVASDIQSFLEKYCTEDRPYFANVTYDRNLLYTNYTTSALILKDRSSSQDYMIYLLSQDMVIHVAKSTNEVFVYTQNGFTGVIKNLTVFIPTELANAPGVSTSRGCNRNLLINPDFKINQRGSETYSSDDRKYTVDCWYADQLVSVSVGDNTSFKNETESYVRGIGQYIEETDYIKGKPVTFALKLSGNETIYTLTTTLPSDTSSIANTVIVTQPTDFGALQIEFETSHFIFKILQSPGATNSLSLEYAKVEIGDSFTGYEDYITSEELKKCYRFYQPYYNGSTRASGFRLLNRTTTYVNFETVLEVPMYSRPSVICPSKTITYYMEGTDHIEHTFTSCAVSSVSSNNRLLLTCFVETNDNTEVLNGKTYLYNWCGGKFDNCCFEANIVD